MSHMIGRRLRAAALLLSLVPAFLAFLDNRAGAQTEEEGPLQINRHAFYTNSASNAFPPILVGEVPPGVVCIVAGIAGAAPVCGEEVQQLKALLTDTPASLDGGLPIPQSYDDRLPQPVPPDSMPVGILGGVPRYYSSMEFALPSLGADEEVARYELVIPENPNGVNVALESPAFRQAVLAAISQVSAQDPAPFVALLEAIVAQETPLVNPSPTGIEACPIVEEWDAGRAQSADIRPEVDCIFGANGQYDPEARTWTFDLTFAAQAWNSGDLQNRGIMLRPVGAENLAYGDPDLSTNFILNLSRAQDGGADLVPQFRLSTFPAAEPVGGLPPLGAPSGPSPVVGNTNSFVSPLPADTSEPASVDEPTASEPGDQVAQPQPISSDRDLAWYAWLMLPIGLGMAFAFGGALTGTPAAVRSHTGALSRLMDVRGG